MSFSFGNRLKMTVFGQSHANTIGVVIDGLPAGFRIDTERLMRFMNRRRPSSAGYSTTRREEDLIEFISGVEEERTCGAPVCAVIKNQDGRTVGYESFRHIPRPSHADYPAGLKYGEHHDVRGGGFFSGRMTAPFCVAGGIAGQLLQTKEIRIFAHIRSLQEIGDDPIDPVQPDFLECFGIEKKAFPTLNDAKGSLMIERIESVRDQNDSVGGVIECVVFGMPPGIGEPLFCSLESVLSQAMFSIPGVRGVEFGTGFQATQMRGSEHNDPYLLDEKKQVKTLTNHHGGIVGGLSTGMPILFRVAMKPTPSIQQPQKTIDLKTLEPVSLQIKGRHDPCIVPRAVPVVEAMTAFVLLDLLLGEYDAWT